MKGEKAAEYLKLSGPGYLPLYRPGVLPCGTESSWLLEYLWSGNPLAPRGEKENNTSHKRCVICQFFSFDFTQKI